MREPGDHGLLVGRQRQGGRCEARVVGVGRCSLLPRHVGEPQALEERRGRLRLPVIVRRAVGHRHPLGRGEELREQVALLGVALVLDRQVRQHGAQGAAQGVGQQRVLHHLAWEEVAVGAHQEQVVEGAATGRRGVEHLHATSGSSQRAVRRLLERPAQSQGHLVGAELKARRELAGENRERRAHSLPRGILFRPAESPCQEGPQPGELRLDGRLPRPVLEVRSEPARRLDRGPQHPTRQVTAFEPRRGRRRPWLPGTFLPRSLRLLALLVDLLRPQPHRQGQGAAHEVGVRYQLGHVAELGGAHAPQPDPQVEKGAQAGCRRAFERPQPAVHWHPAP